MGAQIHSVDYFLPQNVLTNEDISAMFPEWSVEKISGKTGIYQRHIASSEEFASDLATEAAKKLFKANSIKPDEVEFLILCTQSPDFILPTTACLVQQSLGIPVTAGAIDINLGCSGYIYGLSLAKGLIESGQVNNVLLITADTYTKYINPEDKSVRTIFGDGAAATFVTSTAENKGILGTVFGTDGSGAGNLIVPNGGLRPGEDVSTKSQTSLRGLKPTHFDLFMDGPEIFNFTIKVVPDLVHTVCDKNGITKDQVDLFIFHQANSFMLNHLRNSLEISEDKFFVHLENSGNTVSSTIPIALTEAIKQDKVKEGDKIMLVGFGVGLSWGGLLLEW